jgi:GPH family glycoside/pentoside/hexuronide:cation symporter
MQVGTPGSLGDAAPPRSGVKLGAWTLLAFSLPYISSVFLYVPRNVVQGIYAKYFGLSLTTIAGIVLFARAFDAVIDPMCGYLSDRYRARTGTRKPLLVVGGVIYCVGAYLLYSPPFGVTATQFLGAYVVFYVGWSTLEISYLAWGGELAATSLGKTRVFTYRIGLGYLGPLLFYAVPQLPFFSTADVTPQTLHWAVIAGGAMMLPFLYIATTRVPDGHATGEVTETPSQGTGRSIRLWLQLLIKNRPFVLLLAGFMSISVGTEMWYALIFTYVDAYLGLGAQFARMFMLAFVVGSACTPVWYRLIAWLGRKVAWIMALSLLTASFILTGSLQPGETTFAELATLKILNTAGNVGTGILAVSWLADIVDYGTWKSGVSRGASYFAMLTFSVKANAALASSAAFALAAWFGVNAAARAQTERAIFGVHLTIVWLPIAFLLMSLVFIMMIPIDARRHDIILRRLQARESRARRQSAGGGPAPSAASAHPDHGVRVRTRGV